MNPLFFLLLFLPFAFGQAAEHPESPAIERVFGSSPPMNYLLYALNPDKMVGLNFKARNANNNATARFLGERYMSLPVVGSFHGGGKSINLEVLMAQDPQLVLLWEDDMMAHTVTGQIAKTNLPTLSVPFRKIEAMPGSIRTVANAIGEKARGETLAAYGERMIDEVSGAVATQKATRYYYAEGIDGLSTECDASFHVEAFNFAGGENVHKCRQSNLIGLEKISFETLLKYDPDVIIVQVPVVYGDIINDPLWENLRAVREGRVYTVPNTPFNWVDRPPSFMRFLGIQWLATRFHPDVYTIDFEARVREFFRHFFRVEPTADDIQKILGASL
jgi:iron complex transport system substrate-binding protein